MWNRRVLVIAEADNGIAGELARAPGVRYAVTCVPGAGEALLHFAHEVPDCVVIAENGRGTAEMSIRNRIRGYDPNLAVVMLTDRGEHVSDVHLDEDDGAIRLRGCDLDAVNLDQAITDAILDSKSRKGPSASEPPVTCLALIIDDNLEDREACIRALRKVPGACYRFVEASDGVSGLNAIVAETPAIVLLDYSLPGRNGLVVLESSAAEDFGETPGTFVLRNMAFLKSFFDDRTNSFIGREFRDLHDRA